MNNFWDASVWGWFFILALILGSILLGNMLKKSIPFMRKSLIPTSVLGGLILLIIAEVYRAITGVAFFDADFFGGSGYEVLEIITYHCLALGFIASSFKASDKKMTKQRTGEIFNTGVTTVSTYLIQAIFGLAITMIAALIITDFFACAGLLLPFGYGQGTGQAMNYGQIYETDNGFVGGKSFGLTIAALGFLCASIGGVIHLNILKRKGKIKIVDKQADGLNNEKVEDANEIPMQGSVDKLTVQIALVAVAYVLAYAVMALLGLILPGMKSTIFGFNFLIGVLAAIGVKSLINLGRKKNIIKKQYVNNFLMTRISNFFFDLMVVSGIAAIQLGLLENYWGIIAILGVVGMIITYAYNRIVANKLFKDYPEEQFIAMYGMLTGTASTGIILLRELDKNFETPVADNLVYQNLPAIAFGFPIMLLATFAPTNPGLTLGILVAFFAVMNVILFRKQIFRRKRATINQQKTEENTEHTETAE
ncbi:MAG: hypothetical protein E7346_07860 [Clostridiales bacterium]|nr:hypothetical protein [Clostridiales bacterium]